jgi:peptidoglycan/xylan/chitin deacetylase (PgdA/CDA1 family)
MLTWDQLAALHAGGVRIEGHTASHPDLRKLTPDQIDAEMAAADTLIEQRLGRRPAYFAYPYGYHDAAVRSAAKRRYAASFTTELAVLGAEPAERLPRLDSHYLRSPALLKQIEGAPVGLYFKLRYLLRAIRGTQ